MKLSLGERKKRFDPLLGERCEISKGGPPLPPPLLLFISLELRESLSLARGRNEKRFLIGTLAQLFFRVDV